MFVSAVDMTIVNVALPAISEELDAGVSELQWVLDGFLVAFAGLLLLGSGMADRFGRKRVFLSGMAAFGVASVLCALSRTPDTLIGARVLMGGSLACVSPPALSLIAVMYPPEERERALSVWVVVAGAGLVLGPVLGGVLVSQIGWQAVFLVNVPVAVAVVAAGLALLPESRRPGAPPLDISGAALSVLSLGAIVFALIEGPEAGWGSPVVLAPAAAGTVAGALFVRGELRRRYPLFDVRVLRRPAVTAGALALLSMYIALLVALGTGTAVWLVMVLTGVFGALFAFAAQLATGVIMDDLGDEKAGDGGAINQLSRQVGGALGVAVVGTVFAGAYASQVEEELGALPPGHRERASHSIEEARDVLAHLPNGLRDVLSMRVDDAFDSAAHLGFGVCAGVVGLAAVFAAFALAPRRRKSAPGSI